MAEEGHGFWGVSSYRRVQNNHSIVSHYRFIFSIGSFADFSGGKKWLWVCLWVLTRSSILWRWNTELLKQNSVKAGRSAITISLDLKPRTLPSTHLTLKKFEGWLVQTFHIWPAYLIFQDEFILHETWCTNFMCKWCKRCILWVRGSARH